MEIVRHNFKVIDSTNTWAKQHGHTFDRTKMSLITAEEQTAGRGRFKRVWLSPAGQNIYATFCFFVEKHRFDSVNIPQILALSALRTVKSLGFNPQMKWPNDLFLNGKKLGGILAETFFVSDSICMVLGIGINVNMPQEVLNTIDRPATSLFTESGKTFGINEVLDLLVEAFMKDLDLFFEEGFLPFLSDYKAHLDLKTHPRVKVNDGRTILEGTLDSINNDGSLICASILAN